MDEESCSFIYSLVYLATHFSFTEEEAKEVLVPDSSQSDCTDEIHNFDTKKIAAKVENSILNFKIVPKIPIFEIL